MWWRASLARRHCNTICFHIIAGGDCMFLLHKFSFVSVLLKRLAGALCRWHSALSAFHSLCAHPVSCSFFLIYIYISDQFYVSSILTFPPFPSFCNILSYFSISSPLCLSLVPSSVSLSLSLSPCECFDWVYGVWVEPWGEEPHSSSNIKTH